MHLPWLPDLPQRARVVEIGVGGRWTTARQLLVQRPDVRLAATDVHARHLAKAPAGIRTFVDDVTRPSLDRYRGVDLLYAVRCPEELQVPIARLARTLDAGLALHTLKDERVDLSTLLGAPRQVTDGDRRAWRVWAPAGRP